MGLFSKKTQHKEDVMCTCQKCGRKYAVDLIVPDALWEKIKPEGKPKGGGMLCGPCITEAIEVMGEYAAYQVKKQ
jgi:glycyl-tRNA synthetase (class II)